MRTAALLSLLLSTPVCADIVVPAHTIRAQTIISHTDLVIRDGNVPGAFTNPDALIGKETKISLYVGRPIRANDVGLPALVHRNQLVILNYRNGPLVIKAEARALGRGAVGERIKVMNLSSKTTLIAEVRPDGSLQVDQ